MSLPEGAVPQPELDRPPPVQLIRRVTCPYCGTGDVRSNGQHGGFRYYRCRRCASPETMDWTRFKVLIVVDTSRD